ncbi:hypothetical protein MM300_13015 [Evansella sp. LMS18]|jgi:hypothetical protein|uniref:hypothetical protein n=1 Tax=Evansella sp. LMS18 TaxID=2924033 RepID=UPI0020D0A0BA|nr:hypothetical protein [Evansella sp. LMS18]UTR08857.1 hypothetical protein MM300_13015 [Evansella sp. LMS18]
MGHDIIGRNKAGEEVAYARFSMGNINALILYDLLDSNEFHAGVSGTGDSSVFSIQEIQKALNTFIEKYMREGSAAHSDFLDWDEKQILDFLQNCLRAAEDEGSVKVLFG